MSEITFRFNLNELSTLQLKEINKVGAYFSYFFNADLEPNANAFLDR